MRMDVWDWCTQRLETHKKNHTGKAKRLCFQPAREMNTYDLECRGLDGDRWH